MKAKPQVVYTNDFPYLKKLVNEMGQIAAAEAMGLSKSTLGPPMAEGKVRPAWELAAEALWRRRHPEKRPATLFMVQVPADHHETVKAMLSGIAPLGVQFREFKF